MRLLNLTIKNFRGFGPRVETIALEADLVLFFGPNAFGKTSLSEAIEWLLYGSTKRRRRGEQFSRAEYAGSYANVHNAGPTEVAATIRMGSAEYVILRQLKNDETSVTFVDGKAASFASIGLTPIEAIYPVIAQHGLQSFIHSKPKDRRDAISAALGLDELTSFKSSLESARSSFQRTPPREVAHARKELAQLSVGLLTVPETIAVGKRWQKNPVEVSASDDLTALLKAAKRLANSSRDSETGVLDDLRTRRAEASKSVFDFEVLRAAKVENHPFRPVVAAAVKLDRVLNRAKGETTRYLTLVAASYSAALLDFWTTGLGLAPEGEACPMCESSTLHASHRIELKRRIADGAAALASRKILVETLEEAKQQALALDVALSGLGISGKFEPTDGARLRSLLPGAEAAIASLETAHADMMVARAATKLLVERVRGHMRGYVSIVDNLNNISGLLQDNEAIMRAIRPSIRELGKAFCSYQKPFETVEKLLVDKIASSDEVAKIDAVGKAISKRAEIRVLAIYARTLASSQDLIRLVEGEIQKKQNTLLATRGKEVKAFYDRLNIGADVGFESMESANDNMKLHATSFGKRMSAAANLSECQLNCLGLSTFLMRACSPESPFDFVLLDDPVQSMDDGHTEAFIADIVPHLLDDHGKQVIVLSHTRKITDRLRHLNQDRSTRIYHFDAYERGGPTLTEQIGLKMLAAEIRGAMRGNEANRRYAVDRIRVLTEHVIREIYLVQEGKPVPPAYDKAQPKELLQLFRTITGTTPTEHSGIQDTVRFCDPAHHTGGKLFGARVLKHRAAPEPARNPDEEVWPLGATLVVFIG